MIKAKRKAEQRKNATISSLKKTKIIANSRQEGEWGVEDYMGEKEGMKRHGSLYNYDTRVLTKRDVITQFRLRAREGARNKYLAFRGQLPLFEQEIIAAAMKVTARVSMKVEQEIIAAAREMSEIKKSLMVEAEFMMEVKLETIMQGRKNIYEKCALVEVRLEFISRKTIYSVVTHMVWQAVCVLEDVFAMVRDQGMLEDVFAVVRDQGMLEDVFAVVRDQNMIDKSA